MSVLTRASLLLLLVSASQASFSLDARASLYCAASPAAFAGEGVPPLPNASLAHVVVLVRHGDRSAIGRIPGTVRGAFPCGAPTAAAVARSSVLLAPFRSSPACVLAGGAGAACEGIVGAPLTNATDRALRMWGRARDPGTICDSSGGDLSSVGWQQLRTIGAAVAHAYGPFMTGADAEETTHIGSSALAVVSTDTGRTALSAAALVEGVISVLGTDPSRVAARATSTVATSGDSVRDQEESGDESDFTIGAVAWLGPLPLGLHIVPRDEDPMLWPKKAFVCARAGVLQHARFDEIFQHQVLPADIAARLSALTGVAATAMPTTEECADDLLTRSCHGHGLPCWGNATADGKDTRMCLLPEDAATIVSRCDEGYAFRYHNEVTRLLSYPFLRQIERQMARAAARVLAILRAQRLFSASSELPVDLRAISEAVAASLGDGGRVPRVQFRAGHDTVIAPILASLGARDLPHAWPNYGARVIFELWTTPEPTGLVSSLVKIIYNGENWTPRLPCAVREDGPPADACTLEAFAGQIAALIAPHTTWEDACFTTEPHVVHSGGDHPTRHSDASDVGPGAASRDVGPAPVVDEEPQNAP